jgi:nucleotide-binding universal stress UspA family protein
MSATAPILTRATPAGGYVPEAGAVRPLLLATDGSRAADSATRFAAALAARWDVVPTVLSVLPSPSLHSEMVSVIAAGPDGAAEAFRERIARRMYDVVGDVSWPLTLRTGDAATVISASARESHTGLIVMGLRRHGGLDRLFGCETTLRVMRGSVAPVLAVTQDQSSTASRVVVAVDFSRASLRAARLAAKVADPGATMYLTYVAPEPSRQAEHLEGSQVIVAQGIAAAFTRLIRELGAPRGMHVEPVVLNGDPAAELLSFATRADADVIATGRHRRSTLDRLLVGSVTATIVRDARCSVLMAGPE